MFALREYLLPLSKRVLFHLVFLPLHSIDIPLLDGHSDKGGVELFADHIVLLVFLVAGSDVHHKLSVLVD